LGKRTAVIFLLTMVVSSLVGGIILDAIFRGDVSQIVHAHGRILPDWVKDISAVALLGVLVYGIIRSRHNKTEQSGIQ
jgi:hypothetical protein